MSNRVLGTTLVGIFVYAQFAQGQMSSSSYLIRWDNINTGGSDTSNSSSYTLRDSLDQSGAGRSSSTTYLLDQGFRPGVIDEFITFSVQGQSSSGVAATGLAGLTVTVPSSGFSAGNMIAIIENVGASQVVAVGEVASLTGSTITVDSWSNNGTQPTIDGSNDYVYLLSGSSVSLGALSSSVVTTSVIGFDVSVDHSSGYTIQVFEDGNLRAGANDINDVADGAVTAGSEEYGGRSSDTSLVNSTFDTVDTAFSMSYKDLVTQSSTAVSDRSFIILKASITAMTNKTVYAHALSFVASGNF